MTYTATYSPDDNKLRLYSLGRLPPELYARVKAAGFGWAPKQDLFVAPMWTPHREDLLLELCGEIGDEDKSLTERAEERADRFEDYRDSRKADAESARKAVAAISGGIPMGQPILIGHHSERHARKDAERIDNGMRRAVKMWETSKYWTDRAAGAIGHAKYKELPDVRARRIKGIEADKRKVERTKAESAKFLKTYQDADALALTLPDGREFIPALLGSYKGGLNEAGRNAFEKGTMSKADALAQAVRNFERSIAWCDRWLAHYDNRLAYERALLAESGYVEPPKPPTRAALPLLNYGGTVEYRTRWSRDVVTTEAHGMTQAEYAAKNKDYKGTFISADGTHRVRSAVLKGHSLVVVYLTDAKQHTRPGSGPIESKEQQETAARIARGQAANERKAEKCAAALAHNRALVKREPAAPKPAPAEGADFDAMRESLRAGGVQVVTAPQLFPTPPELAARMVELAEIEPHHRVLEPSAGTGNILRAIGDGPDKCAVEINGGLVDRLARLGMSGLHVHRADFLAWGNTAAPSFDRIVMNPPFVDAADIKHIRHALDMLKPGGRLVAICANGPRQREQLQPIADDWIDLPPGTFKEAGTGVNTAILVIDKVAL